MKRQKWMRAVGLLLVLGLLIPVGFSATALAAEATPAPTQIDGNENAFSETPEDAYWLEEELDHGMQLFSVTQVPNSPNIEAKSDTTYAEMQADIAKIVYVHFALGKGNGGKGVLGHGHFFLSFSLATGWGLNNLAVFAKAEAGKAACAPAKV